MGYQIAESATLTAGGNNYVIADEAYVTNPDYRILTLQGAGSAYTGITVSSGGTANITERVNFINGTVTAGGTLNANINRIEFTDLTLETVYTAKVRAVCGGDDGESLWSDALSFEPTYKTIIGSGADTCQYLPTNAFYRYSLTQQIYTAEELRRPSGFIESNEFYQTEAYRKEPSRTLMDCGAIYIGTMNKDLTIRNNYIHDYTGTKDYRGIFGDDGASHVKVYGNVIKNVKGPYSIDFRRVPEVETRKDSHSGPVNVGNRIYGNTVDAPIRFEQRNGK